MNSFQLVQIRKALEALLPEPGMEMSVDQAVHALKQQGLPATPEVVATIAGGSSTKRFEVVGEEGGRIRRV